MKWFRKSNVNGSTATAGGSGNAQCTMHNAQLRKLRTGRGWGAAATAWLLAAGTLLGSAGVAKAFPSWMGVFGSYTTYSGGNQGTFTIALNQDYSGLHAEVGISSPSWATHGMSYIKNDSGNSIWQFTPSSAFAPGTTVEYYFHAWDDWGGDMYGYNDPNASFTTAPTAPTISFSSINTNSLKITVNANGNGSATTYTFSYSTGTPGTPSTSATAGTAKSVTGLSPGTLYNFKARATAGGSTADVTGSQATRAMAPEITSVSYTANSVTFTVTNPNGNGDATDYYYYVGTSSSGTANQTCTPGTPVTVSVNPETTYYIRARALAGGNATYAANYTFTTPADISEPTVTDSGASSVTATSATVGASVNAGGASTTVSFGYSTTSGSYGTAGTVTGSPVTGKSATSVSTALSSLTPGATYYYQWSAYNSVNGAGSPVTATGSFVTLAAVPGAPTLASGSSSSITVTIAAGSNVSSVTYAIKVEQGGTTKYVQADGSLGATAVWRTAAQWGAPVTVTGLTAATTYTVSVAAKNSAGTATAYGTTANVTTASGVQKPTISEGTKTIGTTTATLPITVNMGGGATTANITLKYSTTSGSYTTSATVSPVTLAANVTAGAVSGSMSSLSAGTVYYYQWTVANSAGSTTKAGSFATEPTAGTVTLTTATASSLKVTGKRTNGNAMLIVMKKGSAPSWTPSDGTKYDGVTGDKALTAGTSVGTSEYIVYNGTGGTAADGTSVTISGLDSGSQYYVKVYTYAYVASGTASGYNYNTTSPGSANGYTLSTEPTWSSPSLAATAASTSQINLSWGAASGASGYVVVRKDGSSASTTKPSDGTSYSTGSGLGGTIVYVGSATTYNNTSLSAGSTYSYTVWAYNGVSGTAATYNYLTTAAATATATTTAAEPTTQASGLGSSTYSTTGAKLTWTKGNGTYTLVAGTAASTLTATPTDRTAYTANTTFSSGGQIASGVRTVYTNNSTTVTISGLTANTLYTFGAYSFNGTSDGTTTTYNYKTDSFPTTQFRTTANAPSAAPTISVSGKTDTTMTFSVTKATGSAGTLVEIYTTEALAAPSVRTTYTANLTYGSGTQIGSKGYVVYMGADSPKSIQVTGLTAGTTYYVRAYAYNGTSSATAALCSLAYYTTAYGSASGTTLASEPTTQVTGLSVTARATGSLTLGWTKGNGTYTLVVAHTADPTTAPTDGTTYEADAAWGSAGSLGSYKVVYAGTGAQVQVTGLTAGTRYYFRAYTYNGIGGDSTPPNYKTGSPATANGYTKPNTPTVGATVDGKTMIRLSATKNASGGTTGMVLVYGGSTAPTDGTAVPSKGASWAGGTVIWTGTANASDIEHVVASGTAHTYRLFAYAGSSTVTAYSAAGTPASAPSTGSFASDEIVDTFSYVKNSNLSGLNGEHGWSGAWSISGTGPTIVSQTGSSIPQFPNYTEYPANTGNRIKIAMNSDAANFAATREFPQVTSGTIYAAAIMSYRYAGNKKWCRIALQDGDTAKMAAGRIWESGDDRTIGIDDCNGGRTHGTYNLNPWEDGTDNDYLVIMKYDFSTKTISARAYYHGEAVPSEAPTTWHVTKTLSANPSKLNKVSLQAGADSGGYTGDVYFDEVRVATSWSKLLQQEAVAPNPPTSVTATADGNEMVRVGWTKNAAGNGVMVLATTDGTTPAAPTAGTAYSQGATVGGTTKVAYKGTGTGADLVVAPGTTVKVAVYSYNGDNLYSTAETPAAVTTGTYESWENLETMSYTNGVQVSASGNSWKGGQVWGDNYWGSSGSGNWIPLKPAEVPSYLVNHVVNYPDSVGNVMCVTNLGDGQSATLNRVVSPSVGGSYNNTIYFAYRMAYRYSEAGKNRWAGLQLVSHVGGAEKTVFVGKAAATDHQYHLGINATGASSPCWPNVGSGGNAYELKGTYDYEKSAYVVVGKIQWTADNVANVFANAFYTGDGNAELPENEPSWGSFGYNGASMGPIDSIQFLAGADSGHGQIGFAYFDELRWGTSWEQLLSGKAPTDVWMDGQTTYVYAGDTVTNAITSTPKGAKQSAQSLIWEAANPVQATWDAHAIPAGFYTNKASDTQTEWHGLHLITNKTAVTRYGLGAVSGNGTTIKSQNHGEATYQKHTYSVKVLPAPTLSSVTGGDFKETIRWTRATGYNSTGSSSSGRTFSEVMVVRYSSSAASTAALPPVDGKTYFPGDVIYYNNDPTDAKYMTVVYRGSDATSYVDTGLAKNTKYYYAVFTVNNSYYSAKSDVGNATTTGTSTTPVVDGLTTDWVGGASPTKNSSAYSEEEFIWTDKALEGRKDTDACAFADIGEFRIKATASTVYFLLRLTNAPAASVRPTNTYVVVGVDTRTNEASTAMNWLGDESATFVGGGYWQTNAAIHYPERQMAVHFVGGSENHWQVEMYAENGADWYAPQTAWAAAGSADNSTDPCIEWSVARADLGLDGACTGRFTVATFVNSGVWNNQGVGTVRIGSDSCAAVDAMEFVPYGVNDQDGKLGSWDEGLKGGNVNFWADVRFASAGLDTHAAPTVPAPLNGSSGQASPTLRWNASSDTDGFVTGYLLEVATNAAFGAVGDKLLYRVNVEGGTTTSYQTRTSVSNFYWRVRARDSAGILSSGTVQSYTVTGKTDRDGPLAKLLYVGTNVMAFINNTDHYRDDQEKSGDATSVEDKDLQDGGHVFGFVIEWYDVNGVYATNVNRNTGGCAWNILAEHGDGTPYGRVSPNWDLLIIDRKTPAGTAPSPETVDGVSKSYTWKTGLELPTENGGTETIDCWYIDCGKDAVFTNDCGVTQVINDGNFGLYMTNYVTNAFTFGGYRDGVELYLTVSAEDGCMDTGDAATSGDAGWYPWPSYSGDSAGSYGDDPRPTVNSTGYCKDGPHQGRNVTTNQLLKFYVRDNDVQPPVASTNIWGEDAETASGTKFTPSLVVATSAVTKAEATVWDDIPGKLAPISGSGRDTVYQLTDQAIGRNLTFLFNAYDEYLHSGLQLGNTKTTAVSGRTLTNTAVMVRTWDAETGEWTASDENWADYKSTLSTIYDIDPATGTEAVGTEGTGPNTVLVWDFGTLTEGNVNNLFGVESVSDILSYIGTNSAGSTNLVQLHLRDSDNNREGDQADAELTFGRLMLTDDDATAPEAASFTLLGTGTNMVKFGEVAKSVWAAGPTETFTGMRMGAAQVNEKESTPIAVHSKGADGATGSATLNWDSGDGVAQLRGTMTGTDYTENSEYFEWALTGTAGARWLVDTLTFKNVVTPQGPTMYALTVQDGGTTPVETMPEAAAGKYWKLWNNNNEHGVDWGSTNCQVSGNASINTAAVQTVSISIGNVSAGDVYFKTGPRISATEDWGTMKLQCSFNGSDRWTDIRTWHPTDSVFGGKTWATGKEEVRVDFSAISLDTDDDGTADTPLLSCTAAGNSVRFRWYVEAASDGDLTGGRGFIVGEPKVTTVVGRVTETLLETIRVDKNEGTGGDGTYAKTETQISIPFAAQENLGTGVKTFRLYGYRATQSATNEEAVAAGLDVPRGSGYWGINDLVLQGILSGPKGVEVTDQDVDLGSWTNQVEVMDSLEMGYDTERSGLWMQDDDGEYAQMLPSFTILYPESLGDGLGGTEFWSGAFDVDKYAVAALTAGTNPDFSDLPEGTGWALAGATVGTGTTASGKILSLTGGDSIAGSAVQDFDISPPEGGLASAAVQVTARVRSVLASGAEGATNGFILKAEFKNGGGSVLDDATETATFDANRAWKDYTLGPVSLENSLVREIVVTIAESDGDGTGLEVDSVDISVGVYAPMSDGTPDNGVLGARLMLGTPPVPASVLSTKSMPLSADETDGWKYGMVAKVYDYDHDRTNDALDTGAKNPFRLYDDDEEPPQWGRQFGGPFGVSVNGAPLLSKYRIANGGGTNMVWTLSDHALAEAAGSSSDATIGFNLDFYDYSGWRVTQLQFQKLNTSSGAANGAPETVLSGGTMDAAGTLATITVGDDSYTYARTTAREGAEVADGRDYGAANTPSATVGWTLPVLGFYAANKSAYLSDGNVTNAVNAWVTDVDNDRLSDSLTTNNVAVGNFRLLDQDQLAPHFRPASSGSPKFRATMIATNVPDFASLTNQAVDATGQYALGGYEAHQGATASVAGRTHLIYDGQLLDSLVGGNHFVVSADIVDSVENGTGRSNTGLRRGTTLTTADVSSALEAEPFDLYNSYLALVPAAGDPITLEGAFAAGWSSSDLETKMGSTTRYSSWVWPTNGGTRATATNEVGQWLPAGLDSKAWTLRFNVWDNDMDRAGDQKDAVLDGPTLTVRDDDTTAPTQPGEVTLKQGGIEMAMPASPTRDNVPWVKSTTGMTVEFARSVDNKGAGDPWASGTALETSGDVVTVGAVAGYRLAKSGVEPAPGAGDALPSPTETEGTVSASLSTGLLKQGMTTYNLFAVDADDDRADDAKVSATRAVTVAYDCTLPTAVAMTGRGTGASTASVDDPTTQMDLFWRKTGVGPDDKGDAHYASIPDDVKTAAAADGREETDILSPWLTYKVYYKDYDPQELDDLAEKAKKATTEAYIEDIVIPSGFAGEGWQSVTNGKPIADTASARKDAYTDLDKIATESVRVYDLDFDREYLFVIVGVDKAGNEGPANATSWATNNTIKFAITQGLVRTSAKIDAAIPADPGDTGMRPIDPSAKHGAALYWKAAGQTDGDGPVKKEYDFIYRDARSFDETGSEHWNLVGTVKTNWNYQTDGLETVGGPLRFFRASYAGRWQDAVTNAGTVTKQYPLASEEVYSMNNVVLSEGFNYVSLQGVPWTNTFRGVFGTDTDMWPSDISYSTEAAKIEFFSPGTTSVVSETFFFGLSGTNGIWCTTNGNDVTDVVQSNWFFARPFSIVLPNANITTNDGGVVTTNGWWKDHTERMAKYGSRDARAMLWHPILQVPTNGPSSSGFSQTITAGAGVYNLLALNLPVSVHPGDLGLEETGMARSGNPWEADQLYVVDPATKEVRNGSMMYCDDKGKWRWVKDRSEISGAVIHPNDMLILISSGEADEDWTWTYHPTNFYTLPTRHMGRPAPSGE